MVGTRFLMFPAALIAALVAGCAWMVDSRAPAAPAPTYHVGDRWTYDAADGFRQKLRWVETHEVVAVTPQGISVRVTQAGDRVNNVRTELWPAPGLVAVGALYDHETRRFTTPLQRYTFPLRPGESWNQWVENVNETALTGGIINRYVMVGDWESVSTPAGTFDAIQLRVIMRLDDDDFWRSGTFVGQRVWYAPAVRSFVRVQRDAEYIERDGPDSAPVRTQHATLELRAFSPGA